MDEMRLLRHFEAVYRLSSFSAAARELRLTHSAITKSIKALEDGWEAQLFNRTTRSVIPTEAAKKLYPQAVDLLAFAASVRRSVATEQIEINILSGAGAIEGYIHPAILKFARRYPEARINVATMQAHLAADELLQRRTDILVYHDTSFAVMPHKNQMRLTKVVDEPYLIVYRPEFSFDLRNSSLGDLLLHYDWALPVSRTFEDFLPAKLRNFLKNEAAPRYRLANQTACIELVKQSDLLSVLPGSLAEDLVARGELSAIPLPADFRFAISAAIHDNAAQEPALNHFIDCMKAL